MSNFCPGPLARRNFLQFGGLSLLGMTLADALRFKAQAAEDASLLPRDTSVIFIWLPGGPPHMETYDMKPEAPLEYRGSFKPMSTNVPGTQICELFPLQAKIAIRSCCHEFADHGGGHKRFMTARSPAQPTGFVNDAPAATSIIHKVMTEKNGFKDGMPPVVVGIAAAMRWLLVMAPVALSCGTLKSTRSNTRLPARARSRMDLKEDMKGM